MTQRFEFASEGWLAVLQRRLGELFPPVPAGERSSFSVCEVYTDVPARLGPSPDGRITWHCRIGPDGAEFSPTEADDVDLKVVIDYETVVPVARMVYDGKPYTRADADAILGPAMAAGKATVTGSAAHVPPEMQELHNDLARITA